MSTAYSFRSAFVAIAILALGVGTASAATVIYADDFSGTAGQGLALSPPDTRPPSQTWSANSSFVFSGLGGVATGAQSDKGAYLNFTPEAGNIYKLTVGMVFSSTGSNSGSLQVGFATNAFTTTTPLTGATGGGAPLFFMRQNGSADVRYAGNNAIPNAAQAVGTYTVTNENIVTITLDTTGAFYKFRVEVNGQQLGSDYTYASNPAITRIGIAANNTAGAEGRFTNLSLTAEAVPEPSMALLGVVGLASLTLRRRRVV